MTGEWVHLAVPYPMGFFAKGLDGRVDDPDGGWKACALGYLGGRSPSTSRASAPRRMAPAKQARPTSRR